MEERDLSAYLRTVDTLRKYIEEDTSGGVTKEIWAIHEKTKKLIEECTMKLDETRRNCKYMSESLRLKEILLSACPYKIMALSVESADKKQYIEDLMHKTIPEIPRLPESCLNISERFKKSEDIITHMEDFLLNPSCPNNCK